VLALEFRDSGREEIRDTAEITNVDTRLEDCPSTRKPSLVIKIEISNVDPPVILKHLQVFFNSFMASMRAENLELASKIESSAEQMKESNNQFIEEFRRDSEQLVEQLRLES
jgi:hypothetical protein